MNDLKLAIGKIQGLSWGEIIKGILFVSAVAATLYFTVQENTKAVNELKGEVIKLRTSNNNLKIKQIQLETTYMIQIANIEKRLEKVEK